MSTIEDIKPDFEEVMRPQKLDDLFLPESVIARFKQMIEVKWIPDMIFSGPSGNGKTSAARIITEGIGADILPINGADLRRGRDWRSVKTFVFTYGLGGQKVVHVDDAEFVPPAVQAELRGVLEEPQVQARFLFTTNSIGKIDPAIQSRMTVFDFSIERNDRSIVVRKLLARYTEVLTGMKVPYDPIVLRDIITGEFPDLRQVAKEVEQEFLLRPPVPAT